MSLNYYLRKENTANARIDILTGEIIKEREREFLRSSSNPANSQASITPSKSQPIQTDTHARHNCALIMDLLKNGSGSMMLNGEAVDISKMESILKSLTSNPAAVGNDRAHELLGIDPIEAEKNNASIVALTDLFKNLTVTETELQTSGGFNSNFYDHEGMRVVDTSSMECAYMMSDGDDGLMERSGKPDGSSTVFPLFFEMKGKNYSKHECLLQGLRRIHAASNMHGIFKKFMAMTIDRETAWVVWFDIDQTSKERQFRSLSMLLVERELLFGLWLAVTTKALKCPAYVYSEDAWALTNALKQLGLRWDLCLIQLLRVSSSRIYRVQVGDGKNKGAVDPKKSFEFVIKANGDASRFETEVAAMEAVAGVYAQKHREFYARAYVRGDRKGEMQHFPAAFGWTLPQMDYGAIKFEYILADFDLGDRTHAIVMRVGQPIKELSLAMCWDVSQSLDYIHEAGYVHTDIRSTNILYFPVIISSQSRSEEASGAPALCTSTGPVPGSVPVPVAGPCYQVIDFDLCVKLPPPGGAIAAVCDTVSVMMYEGSRATDAPKHFQDQLQIIHSHGSASTVGVSVAWSKKDDIKMFYEYVIRKFLKDSGIL
jgi:hypothetical protein